MDSIINSQRCKCIPIDRIFYMPVCRITQIIDLKDVTCVGIYKQVSLAQVISVVIFFIIGIRYFKALKQADSDADEEENTYNTVMNWFREHHPADLINDRVDMTESDEQLFFARYENMSHLI